MKPPVIFWFRRDLRLADHPALVEASEAGPVIGVWIIDDALVQPAGPTRTAYLVQSLKSLSASMNGALVIRHGAPADVLTELCRETGARSVYATGDFAPYGRRRDEVVKKRLSQDNIDFHLIGTPYIVTPGTVMTKAGTPCRVFSAFRRGWEMEPVGEVFDAPTVDWKVIDSLPIDDVLTHAAHRRPDYFGDLPDVPPPLPPAGEKAGWQALLDFAKRVDAYSDTRNLPGTAGTSRLSPFLKVGSIHPRTIVHAVQGVSSGRTSFISEICWREFYADVLFHQPESIWRNLQSQFDHLAVDRDDAAIERFQVWARGETGYPLVDAGMRQLLSEGWMHNRVRMVVASFLVKHLHLDWRWGAKWFMWRLIDGDIASNQHGWQWTAGTGTDAAPYHRVFNPTLQAERFDPEGTFVHRQIPELQGVSAPQCLQPGGGEGLLAPSGYARPMIDAASERDEALRRFSEVKTYVESTRE